MDEFLPESKSQLITKELSDQKIDINKSTEDFRFAASVASFGMLLRDSEYQQNSSYQSVLTLALASKGSDKHGYRQEFINLVRNTIEFDREKL